MPLYLTADIYSLIELPDEAVFLSSDIITPTSTILPPAINRQPSGSESQKYATALAITGWIL